MASLPSAPGPCDSELTMRGGLGDVSVNGVATRASGDPIGTLPSDPAFQVQVTEAGRRMDAVGGNAEASRLAGINVRRYRFAAFVIAAVVAAVAGVVLAAGRTGSAVTLVGNQGSYLLQAFTACFLGAVTLREGEFHFFGTAVGVLLMTVTFSGLIILGVPGYAQTIANGAILIAALAFAGLARRAANRA